ncbi:hypothetical protein J5X84_15670 [Streptosporangiaceae bacterium NEAU-GS5]|nr:hypothetical protein [Streptosporangiaceae bacterium NEAU-GS5]
MIIGAGVGYPLATLLAELGGVRAAYGLGPVVTAAALLTASRSMPEATEGRSAHVDVAGAVVQAAALLLVLFLASERDLWSRHLAVAAGLAVVAVVLLLCVWAVIELRSTTPLVDVLAVRHPAVAGAKLAMFVGGIGMYVLLTLITRYAQTPHGADARRHPGRHPESETSSAMSFNYSSAASATPVAFVTYVPLRMMCHHGYRHFDDKGCAMTAQRHRRPTPPRRWSASASWRSGRYKPRPRPPTLVRDQPVRQMHSCQHWRFHAQGLLGQRLPHHCRP